MGGNLCNQSMIPRAGGWVSSASSPMNNSMSGDSVFIAFPSQRRDDDAVLRDGSGGCLFAAAAAARMKG